MLYFNGVNATRKEYDLQSMPMQEFARIVLDQPLPADKHAGGFYEAFLKTEDFAPAEDRDPKALEDVGWGVIFAHDEDQAVIDALQPLLKLRQKQAGDCYYEYSGSKYRNERQRQGYMTGEDKMKFLENRGVEPFGPADPNYAPYYLLIVGDPEKIPFKFQYQLDVQYAVGRIFFRSPEEYAQYAANVVTAETRDLRLARRGLFFGVNHDPATNLSATHLVKPLMEKMKTYGLDWAFQSLIKDQATKANLSNILNQGDPPALLFTGSHGVGFDADDPLQIDHQGALLCQDWSFGKKPGQKIEDCYFCESDLATNANLSGMIAFHFACYSAGTPRQNDFSIAKVRTPETAPYDFVARLPQRLLLNGAVAVIGHIERAWGCSISYSEPGENKKHLGTYSSTMKRLLEGHPVGSALEWFDEKYGEISAGLTDKVERFKLELPNAPTEYELISLWRANNDARNYIIVGDPAARMPTADAGETSKARPVRETVSIPEIPDRKDDQPEDYSFDLRSTGRTITRSLKDVTKKMGDVLESIVDDLSTLEVLTYTGAGYDLKQVYDAKTKKFNEKASLKAVTRISLDGDISHIVPARTEAEGEEKPASPEIDKQLWEIHRDMVKMAQENKVAFVKAVAEVAGTLLNIAKGK